MGRIAATAIGAGILGLSLQAAAEITFYEREGFQGRSYATHKQLANFESAGFNDRASSVIVTNDRWEACEHSRFGGRCVVLRPGQYPSLAAMGLDDRVSSVRMVAKNVRVEDERYAPQPVVDRDYRRRRDERTYEAEVTSVYAVMGQPTEQRCWVERDQAPAHGDSGSAVTSAVIGGILGYQAGGRRGNDVRRCENVPAAAPHHWDVTYNFRGRDHRMQMNAPPGRTVLVNARGEPRA